MFKYYNLYLFKCLFMIEGFSAVGKHTAPWLSQKSSCLSVVFACDYSLMQVLPRCLGTYLDKYRCHWSSLFDLLLLWVVISLTYCTEYESWFTVVSFDFFFLLLEAALKEICLQQIEILLKRKGTIKHNKIFTHRFQFNTWISLLENFLVSSQKI